MTPYQFAKAECANLLTNGSCLAIWPKGLFNPALPASPRESCVLKSGLRERCLYFELAVLPVADQSSPKEQPRLQERRLKASAAYRQAVQRIADPSSYVGRDGKRRMGRKNGNGVKPDVLPGRRASTCPDCQEPRAKGKRFCEGCADKRRKETYRRSWRKRRDA